MRSSNCSKRTTPTAPAASTVTTSPYCRTSTRAARGRFRRRSARSRSAGLRVTPAQWPRPHSSRSTRFRLFIACTEALDEGGDQLLIVGDIGRQRPALHVDEVLAEVLRELPV